MFAPVQKTQLDTDCHPGMGSLSGHGETGSTQERFQYEVGVCAKNKDFALVSPSYSNAFSRDSDVDDVDLAYLWTLRTNRPLTVLERQLLAVCPFRDQTYDLGVISITPYGAALTGYYLERGPDLTFHLSSTASLLRRLGEYIQQFQESSGLGLALNPGPSAFPKEGWLEQPLDPFNTSDGRSFLQRYWVNDKYWVTQDGPVFLHLGGESSLGPGSVMKGHPAALAPTWGALVIGLEHRFYGLSVPAGGLNIVQLRFLSSRHALADVASARLALSRVFNVSSSSPWICFGGSYAGSLAAWARLKFPHLIFASIASSAPVRAVLDFSEYNDVVSRSLKNTAIGGSPECRAAVSAAFAEVERRLRAGGAARATLRAELGACGSLDRTEDQAELLGALQALVGGAVQYDGQEGAPLGVRQFCRLLLGPQGNFSHPAAYRGLRRAVKVLMHSLDQRCLSFSRAETVAQLRITEPQVSSVGDRQWLYQTCTEFGFYVTCEDPKCPFSQLPALPSYLELCEQVFGLSASSIAQAVVQTNSYYGGQTPGATHLLFINGDTDPWHALSITQNLGPSESALLIPSSSHCMDMAPERPSDSPSLRLGRQNIHHQLKTWLRLAKENQDSGPGSGTLDKGLGSQV
ncbi:thymus-specific serine protease [Erinaceus europaeus]|uniref:Thymus-specific serine protease n=1 Tax=Erinaceus europaeus TaxID=9365 RepID=A0ABM3WTN5_ERIEU|nr:thymus-specific serine protease [Erinaceus europaeus]